VHVLDDAVLIEGQHEERSSDGNSYVAKHFSRK
jgi:hypothetical protein